MAAVCHIEMVENNADGLIEKSRDMGATWVCCAFSVWMWLFVDHHDRYYHLIPQ
jgi:hypothetical protein